ncbi:MAG: DUF3553 domain-containing protein [Vicinamibacterales bacterium]
MAYKEGGFVRHRARPEWGVGRIDRLAGDNLLIQFREAARTLNRAIAEPYLDEATAKEFGIQSDAQPQPARPKRSARSASTKSR